MIWLKRLLITTLLLAIIAVPGYYLLVLDTPAPEDGGYVLDMDQVRALADSLPGDKASEIRVEKVAEFQFAEAMVMAGEPWRATPIPVHSYQLVLPEQTIIIDTAVASTRGVPDFMVTDFDPLALQRMNVAMRHASQIFITHEHFDHIAGLFEHPDLAALMPAVRLTREQLNHPDRMAPSEVPEQHFAGYQALTYDDMLAVAPGVVLIRAAGHTPGSQMIYVRLASGEELLLLGDVAWQMRNIRFVRERPLFMTAMIKEDRNAVINQFQALNLLAQREPGLHMVPGHELGPIADLVNQGIMKRGFRTVMSPRASQTASVRP